MSDIEAFLNARIDEDQAAAEAAHAVDPAPWKVDAGDDGFTNQRYGHGAGLVTAADGIALWDCEGSNTLCMTAPAARHVARNDPARALREVAAKRAIMARHYESNGTSWSDGHPYPKGHCVGCGYAGDCDDAVVEDVNDCPELRILVAIYDERWRP